MKRIFLALALMMASVPVVAQTVVDPNKPDAELSKDEAVLRITEWQNKVNILKTRLDALNAEMTTMRGDMTSIAANIKRCNDELYALVGASEADVNSFRERLGQIATRVAEMGRMSNDDLAKMKKEIDSLEMRLNGMRREKIALLPEFYNRIIQIARDIQGLRRTGTEGTYTVGTWAKDRDCLWNISAKEGIYNDPFMWPKIWQANTDQIRNPDIIQPGQVLRIPPAGPKTDEELRAERLYFRNKHAGTRRASIRRASTVPQEDAGSGR
jgi:nucleoid-associated protein YgaU